MHPCPNCSMQTRGPVHGFCSWDCYEHSETDQQTDSEKLSLAGSSMAEHLILDQEVEGSTPSPPAKLPMA